ncbi:MAG TPA: alanine--tRNA ligase [Candidatus Dormibacteraeota bacterium]|nr:alanine--tRNA ligase [Candidatus Dormibacteraeota bacterium]
MTGNEIRKRFLEHFARREHLVLPSAPLVPQGDPSTLFISAGMQPLQPYYLGLSRPPAPRLASAQKCLRTGDIEEVGKTDRHGTFFEMLGNFAPTGDYFKETAIPLAWDLVTTGFAMPVDRLRVTVHPSDDEAFEIWTTKTGIPAEHVTRLGDNWWGLGRGPCGPDSEIWWDRGREAGCGQPDCHPDHCERFTEFWNLVFPQYDQHGDLAGPPSTAESIRQGIADGALIPLARPAIDTGMGLERISYILQGKSNIFETDLFQPLIDFVRHNSKASTVLSERLIADHIRASTFVIGGHVLPSNEGRGYVLRRLIRRAALHARRVGLTRPLTDMPLIVGAEMHDAYPELQKDMPRIVGVLGDELVRFDRTLEQGMEQFEKIATGGGKTVSGADAFRLHDTFGFPLELTRELASDRGLQIDEEGFRAEMARQRERSRRNAPQQLAQVKDLPRSEFTGYRDLTTESKIVVIRRDGAMVEKGAEGDTVEVFLERSPFYAESGGQIGDTGVITTPGGRIRVEDTQKPAEGVIAHVGTVESGEVTTGEDAKAAVDAARRRQIARHHSATHLLHKALRETLGEQVVQKGSWVGPDHTTFDIPFNRAIAKDELDRINRRVMERVRAALPFHESQKPYREAVEQGAMHLFEEKYGDVVRVVCFGDWTCELCGGTHVENSADVGTAVIVSESSIGSGLRRIDMVVGESADRLIRHDRQLLTELANRFNAAPEQLPERINALRVQLKEAERERDRLRDQLRTAKLGVGDGFDVKHGSVDYVAATVEASSVEELRSYADRYLERVNSGVVTLVAGDKFVIKVSNDLVPQFDATRLKDLFGQGGGRPQLVSGKLTVAPEEAFRRLDEALGGA